jgi:hypothetical protein
MQADTPNIGSRRSVMTPCDEIVDFSLQALRYDFNRPVRAIHYPTCQVEPPGFLYGGGAKINPLHSTFND